MEISEKIINKNQNVILSKSLISYVNGNKNYKIISISNKITHLNITVYKKFGFKIGKFIYPTVTHNKRSNSYEEFSFFNELYFFLRKSKIVDFIIPPLHFETFHNPPKYSSNISKLGIIKLNISKLNLEDIFKNFKPICRRHIRKAERDGIKVIFGLNLFDDFYEIYSERLKNEGAIYDSYKTIYDMVFNKNNPINVEIGVAYKSGKKQAAILNINDKKVGYYMYGGVTSDAHNGSLRLLHWKIIQKYSKKEIEVYKLGGNREGKNLTMKHQNLSKFKMEFGCEIDAGFHFTFVVNKMKFLIYNCLINLK